MIRSVLRESVTTLGAYVYMLRDVLFDMGKNGVRAKDVTHQVVQIGTQSLPIIILTGAFTGMVLALQTAYGLERFGAKNYVGNIVGLGIIRELGPVLTALMLCGRVGAGIAAQISSMVVTEQIDAMRALGASPIQRLVTPRILAALIAVPALVVVADIVGIYGGLLIAVYELDISAHLYYRSLAYTIFLRDIFNGLIKSTLFGFLIVSVACFLSFRVRGGTAGVGKITTKVVVTTSVIIFISDFFITKLLWIFSL